MKRRIKRGLKTGSRLRRWFLSGLVVVVPLVVTYLVLRFVFETVDGILGPAVAALHGKPVPGLGLLVTLVLILVVGAVTAGVVGRPDEVHGEEVVAFVTLRAGLEVGERELEEYAKERLGGYKYPREIRIVPQVPLTPVGKVDRKALRALANREE